MGLVAFSLVRQAERDTLAAHRQRQIGETVRVVEVISRRVVQLQRALRVTASKIQPVTLADPSKLAAFIRTQPVLNSMFSNVFAISSAAPALAAPDDPAGAVVRTDPSDVERMRERLASGILEPTVGRAGGRPVVITAIPVSGSREPVDALAGSLSLDSRDLLADLVDEDDSGTLVVISDLEGRVLAHPDRRAVMGRIASLPRLNEAFGAWVRSGAAAETAGVALPQESDVVSICAVPGTNWIVWRAVPKDHLLGPLNAARAKAVKLVVALLAGASLVMFGTLARLLRPLGQLASRAQNLFDGTQPATTGWPAARGEIGHLTTVLRRVATERLHYQSLNEEMLKKLSSIMGAAPIGIAFARDERFELVSAEFCRLVGRTEAQLLGAAVDSIFSSANDYLELRKALFVAFTQGRPCEGECALRRADGTAFVGHVRGCALDARVEAAGSIWTLSDVTAQVASRTQLEWSAGHDALTGLANRKLLENRLRDVFANDETRRSSAVVVIDLDGFKPVNDLGGHATGDDLLRRVATAISSCVRSGDLVARTGGDEFALVLERCSLAMATKIAENVRVAIGTIELECNGQRLRIGASLGVCEFDPTLQTFQGWLDRADALCYEAKRAGRGTVRSLAALPGHR